MSFLTKIKKFFTTKKEQKIIIGAFLNDSFNVFDYKKNLLKKVQKSHDIQSARNFGQSGAFTREFAELVVAKKLEKAGLSYQDARFNATHLFIHIDNQIFQLKKNCKIRTNFVGMVETGDAPENYCSNFGQIDFYVTVNKGGAMNWTMNAGEFGFPTERDVKVTDQIQREKFENSITASKDSVENYLNSIETFKVQENPKTIQKEHEKMNKARLELGELANVDVIEKAMVETDSPELRPKEVLEALHSDNKLKEA